MTRYFDMYSHIVISGENESCREKQEKERLRSPRRGERETTYIRGIPPQIIVIYTTMSPILFIFGPKVAPQVLVKNPKNF